MILLIISICVSLFFLILTFYYKDDIYETLVIILTPICVAILFIVVGYTWKPDLDRKQELEVLLANDCNADTISKAQEYNKDVNKYNNYLCRFSIEDRSEYYIDIDSFLDKKVEE